LIKQPDELISDNVTPTDVRMALERTLGAAGFKDAPQTSAFLKFIVEETLAGREHELKGYTIATLALGRPE
jgi:hypothetical protein